MFQKFKVWVIEQVLWVEQNMKGLSGAEKKAAIVRRLDDLIKLPWYMEWIDGYVIEYFVDYACEKLNLLSDWNFSSLKFSSEQIEEVASILSAPMNETMSALSSSDDVNARLDELYKKYGIEKEPVTETLPPVPVAPVAPPVVETPKDENFERSITFSLKWEGGANFDIINGKPVIKKKNENDPGGLTKYGITHATLADAYFNGIVPHKDIVNLTVEEARKIYRKNYWDRRGWGDVSWAVCLCCLDSCILHGGFAWILQRALNDCGSFVAIDGKFGPETFKATVDMSHKKSASFVASIAVRREDYMRNIVQNNPSQSTFLDGWLKRNADMKRACA